MANLVLKNYTPSGMKTLDDFTKKQYKDIEYVSFSKLGDFQIWTDNKELGLSLDTNDGKIMCDYVEKIGCVKIMPFLYSDMEDVLEALENAGANWTMEYYELGRYNKTRELIEIKSIWLNTLDEVEDFYNNYYKDATEKFFHLM